MSKKSDQKDNQEKLEIEELNSFVKKKKIENSALKKIIEKLNSPDLINKQKSQKRN